ncbi:MAG: hypothetical protein EZS28_014610 [Streblomastix strix]|uniref:Uncharacterized protein n=1 Tax=Streblomastix strix TaxID=222440 RepID=A0A5J4W4E4_9EUKA|nr:MAG: hypothetical protein EZS28_014610 [Streblomastix strix]
MLFPDQVTPASDTTPKVSIVEDVVGTSSEYDRGDHQHPLKVSDVLPAKDTAKGEEGVANTYVRSDHTHYVNLSSSVPKRDTGTGTAGASNAYTRSEHQDLLNIDPIVANVPLVNATAAANDTSDYYCRNDHVHPQQLSYTGPLTSTMFIKSVAQATIVLLSNGDSKPISDIILMQILKYFKAISYDNGLRISRSDSKAGNATVQLGCSRTSNTDAIE